MFREFITSCNCSRKCVKNSDSLKTHMHLVSVTNFVITIYIIIDVTGMPMHYKSDSPADIHLISVSHRCSSTMPNVV